MSFSHSLPLHRPHRIPLSCSSSGWVWPLGWAPGSTESPLCTRPIPSASEFNNRKTSCGKRGCLYARRRVEDVRRPPLLRSPSSLQLDLAATSTSSPAFSASSVLRQSRESSPQLLHVVDPPRSDLTRSTLYGRCAPLFSTLSTAELLLWPRGAAHPARAPPLTVSPRRSR